MNRPANPRGAQPQTQPGQCTQDCRQGRACTCACTNTCCAKPLPTQRHSVLWWVTAALVALLMAGAIVLMGMPQHL